MRFNLQNITLKGMGVEAKAGLRAIDRFFSVLWENEMSNGATWYKD